MSLGIVTNPYLFIKLFINFVPLFPTPIINLSTPPGTYLQSNITPTTVSPAVVNASTPPQTNQQDISRFDAIGGFFRR
jgi:hypothetical protein